MTRTASSAKSEQHRNLKNEYKKSFLLVKGIIHSWDPYNLISQGAPEDEFDWEIARVVCQLNRIHSAKDAAQVLSRVFTSGFGDAVNPESCLKIGQLLFSVIGSRNNSFNNPQGEKNQ